MTDFATAGWNQLHEQTRFRPLFPSEAVVRFVARRFGGIGSPPTSAARLLDIGCGAGRHTILMAQAGHTTVGIDPSDVGLHHTLDRVEALGLENVRLEIAPMTELPFESNSFDGAVSYGVFLYGDEAAFRTAVNEAHRVLAPGGRLLVVTRTVDDMRMNLGDKIEDRTVLLESDATNESGFMMHFLDRDSIDRLFAGFEELIVDRNDHTDEGGAIKNSDWIIEARK